jgi:hypothetical protein
MTSHDTQYGERAATSLLEPSGLRETWRRLSLADGWSAEDDWWTAAVDAVTAAACRGDGLPLACGMLGRARARAGIGIGEALLDLAALFAALGSGDPPLYLVSSLAEGWAEAGLARLSEASCEDPLTGLATLPYLRTRLGEVYRAAQHAGTRPAESHRLVVVELPRRPDPWKRMALAIVIAHELRAAFPGGQTLSLAGPGLVIVLVGACPEFSFLTAGLRRAMGTMHGVRIRLAKLPARHEEALRLLDGLAR